jgi:hypothetical protein
MGGRSVRALRRRRRPPLPSLRPVLLVLLAGSLLGMYLIAWLVERSRERHHRLMEAIEAYERSRREGEAPARDSMSMAEGGAP